MAANFADPPLKRADWSSRTADLDTGTTDLHERTSDLVGVRTEDFDTTGAVPVVAGSTRTPQLSQSPSVPNSAIAIDQHALKNPSEHPDPATSEVRPGTVLNDRFLIEKIIGHGGTATVFCARDLQAIDGRSAAARVAIKVPSVETQDPQRAISRLQHEFRHAQSLKHPNIVRVLALDNDQQTWFMTMEIIEGKSLSAVLRDREWLSDGRKHAILRSCAEALSFAHSHQIVHGDFKPANVLITPDGQAKVFDFGAAAATSGDDTRIPAGTPAYASPQVLSGEHPDARDDVFSFACVAYELLTGDHPFNRRSSVEAREQGLVPQRAWNLSADQWLALLAALAWEREQRPLSVTALMADLTAPPPARIVVPTEAQVSAPGSAPIVAEAVDEIAPPPQRTWGFFSFVLIALAIGVLFLQRDPSETAIDAVEGATLIATDSGDAQSALLDIPRTAETSTSTSFMSIVPISHSSDQKLFGGEGPTVDEAANVQATMNVAPEKVAKPPVPSSTFTFAQDRIETPEGSIAAVFIVTRSPPLSGRATVNWKIASGSASLDEDFIASASGTVNFGDGQSQRAIYIPLRNDLDAEGDETFTLELTSPQRGRLGSVSRVEATIRDDD